MSETPITVDSLITPERIRRRLLSLSEQQLILTQLFPPSKLSRWQRFTRRAAGRRDAWREAVAVKIAPWLS